MRCFPLVPPVLVALLSLACEPAAESGAQGGSLALNQGSQGAGANTAAQPQGIELREFVYPESTMMEATWVVQALRPDGTYERYEERFLADGNCSTRLDILGYSPDMVQAFAPPSSDLLLDYQNRMRFLVKYRNVHVRAFHAAWRNFEWIEDPTLVQVAGVDCIRTTAVSRHGHGSVEILSDAQTDLVLGWTKFAPNGSILLKLETTSLDFNPNLTGVSWSSAVVGEQDLTGFGQGQLAFEPSEPDYLPAGFYEEEAWLRFSAGLFPGMSDMLVKVYSDGLHLMFVAQHDQAVFHSTMTLVNKLSEVKQYDLGGIRVAEGTVGKRKYYVASLMSLDEILTVFGSLVD